MPEWSYAVIGFIVLTVILSFFVQRQRKTSWQGTVQDIREHTYLDSNETHQEEIHIYCLLDNGRKKKLVCSKYAFQRMYSDLKVGDKLSKLKGEYSAKKIQ